jgi:hypothetical protein
VPLLLVVAAGFAFIVSYSRRVTDWIVMTDELLYAKLSLSIADTLSPLPVVHDERISLSSQLYPLLTAPIYALFDMPTAFHAVHVANAAILASAAVPAYLLARDVLRWQAGGYLAAAFSLAIPWLVLGSYGLTEVVAYPAFLWAILAIHRATVAPSLRADLLAVAAIVLAILARTQFFVLAPAFPLVIALHEVGYRLVIAGRRRGADAWDALRSAVTSHRALAAVTGIAALLALVLAAVGSLDRLLGPYAVTATEGSLLPSGVAARGGAPGRGRDRDGDRSLRTGRRLGPRHRLSTGEQTRARVRDLARGRGDLAHAAGEFVRGPLRRRRDPRPLPVLRCSAPVHRDARVSAGRPSSLGARGRGGRGVRSARALGRSRAPAGILGVPHGRPARLGPERVHHRSRA